MTAAARQPNSTIPEINILDTGTFGQRFFAFLSDPNVASVLFLAGLLGLYVEFNSPGLIIPGVAGAVCLVLTAIALQILPFSWVGLLVMFAGLAVLLSGPVAGEALEKPVTIIGSIVLCAAHLLNRKWHKHA